MFLLFNFLSVLSNLISVKVDSILAKNSLSFVTNNVQGIQSSKKILKFNPKCQRQNSVNWSMISTRNSPDCQLEQKWKRDFKEHVVFFLTEKQILVVSWLPAFTDKKQETDKEGRVLLLDASISDAEYTLTLK